MMFLTQISGTVLQSLRLSDTVGIIMEAAIIAGLFNIGGILLTYLLTKKDTLKKLDKKMDAYHTELKNSVDVKNNTLSAEHAGLKEQINNGHAGLKEQINNKHAALEKQLSGAQTRLDHLHDESIRMEGFRKDVEKQGIDATALKASIDALVQKNGENTDRVRDLTRDLEKSEQALADTEKKLRDREWELAQYQRENEQLKQQIYDLQHPQQSWDELER